MKKLCLAFLFFVFSLFVSISVSCADKMPQSETHNKFVKTAADIKIQLADIRLEDETKPRKIIFILGAGMAGLTAAYELKNLGHTVSIIEASDRVGGRVWTHRFPDGQYHELGAMRIPKSHYYTKHYIEKCGLQLRTFCTSHDDTDCYYYLRGKVVRIKNAPATMLDHFSLSSHEKKVASEKGAPSILGIHLDNINKSLTDEDKEALLGERLLTERIAQLDRLSIGQFLEDRLSGADTKELIGVTTGLEALWDKALTMFLREELTEIGNGLKEIVGGMDYLPETMANNFGLKELIKFNSAVTSIKLREDKKIELRIRKNNKIEEIVAEHVICTIPFTVLRGMHIEGLTPLKMRAIRNLHYTSSTKVLFHCTQRFWENEDIFGGASLTDQITRATYYPSDHAIGIIPSCDPSDKLCRGLVTHSLPKNIKECDDRKKGIRKIKGSNPGVLVGSYNWGDDARTLGALKPEERAEVVLKVVEKFHPTIKDHIDTTKQWHKSVYWDEEP